MDTATQQNAIFSTRERITQYPLTGNEDQGIALTEAAMLTRNFRISSAPGAVKGCYCGREILERILAQEPAVGIRIHHARHSNGNPTFVLSGIEAMGNDLFDGVLSEELWPCPPWCSSMNPLNADTAIISRNKSHVARFTGKENHFVTLAEATRMMQAYEESCRENRRASFYISRRTLSLILAQSACVGIRIYYALLPNGILTLVLVGVDEEGSDLAAGVIAEAEL